jgi:hypothetical protein
VASKKPSYLGLLNAVAQGEARAGEYLAAWAEVTTDPALERALRTVVARELEHGAAFAKRIDELGYSVLDRPDPEHAKRLRFARSATSDVEKLERFGFDRDPALPDIFERFFADHTIDVQTGALLGRYVAEERDTARLLHAMWRKLKRKAAAAA